MCEGVYVVVTLAGSINAIRPMKARVEPLRRVRSTFLGGKHVTKLVKERAGVFFFVEVTTFPAPICPCACQAIKDLAAIDLGTKASFFFKFVDRLFVRY